MSVPPQPSKSADFAGQDSRPRRPIYWQLLAPMVLVVLLSGVLATTLTATWIASRVRSEQGNDLRRIVETFGASAYPLNKSVLEQIRGLSGAEFAVLTPEGELRQSTLPLERPWREDLARLARSRRGERAERHAAISLGARDYLVDFVGISDRAHSTEPATLFVLYPEEQLSSRIHQAVAPALLAGAIAVGIAVGAASWLARRFARPIRTLVEHTASIARGDFTPMPAPPRNDELSDLAESINRMTVQLADHQRQALHNERLSTLGRLGAAMAHQLRNAATGGRLAVELHRRDCPRAASDESLDVALRQMRLMETYLRQFLAIGRPAAPVRQRVDCARLVEEVLSLVRPACVHAGIDLRLDTPDAPVAMEGDPESLRQLVANLALNAADAAASGDARPPRVVVEILSKDDGRGLLRVKDTGRGPPPEIRDQLFRSFVTTKPDGFGLGLFVAHEIAERHGGRLDWRREGEWTCFEFEFSTEK